MKQNRCPEEDEVELGEAKAQAELSVARQVWQVQQVRHRVALRGRVVTGDALYCQRTLCREIQQAQGHYLFVIKANQPELLDEVALLFDRPPPGEHFAQAVSRRPRHGRNEVRPLLASTAWAAYVRELGWVAAQQVLRLESSGTSHAKTTQLVR